MPTESLSLIPRFPDNDYGPLMKGLVIGGMGIFHVFLAQFAIGGGFLMLWFERLRQRRQGKASELAGRFLDGYFKVLVLVSFVIGALTGVGMWLTSIQVSAPTIGTMVREFHWLWATEYVFFWLEIFAGYAFYRYAARLSDGLRMRLLWIYSVSGWMSLFWINGILAWQLTPGAWVQTHNIWDGFFNPSFWPSLLYRTAACLAIAALAAMVVINTMELERGDRRLLINRAARFLLPMMFMPALGAWYFWSMPPDSRSWVAGGSVAMTMFLTLAVGASVLIGGYALVGLNWQRQYISGATATLLLVLAFAASAGGEFVREGARKPYSIRAVMYSNAIRPEVVGELRRVGCTTDDPYPLRNAGSMPTPQVALGAKVYRVQCAVCHTLDGANGLVHLTGSWTIEQVRFNLSHLQHTKAFMPPFAGTPEELEALVQWTLWQDAGRPDTWKSTAKDRALVARLQGMLDDAGVAPGNFQRHRQGGEPDRDRRVSEAAP